MASRNQVINKWVNRYPTGLRHRVEGFGGVGQRGDTAGGASSVTLSYSETGKTCHNLDSTNTITFNLPANADPGVHFRFVTAADTNTLQVKAPADDKIIINDSQTAGGATISVADRNGSITVEFIGKDAAGTRMWIAYSEEGTWT
jgi:hypothetical protein